MILQDQHWEVVHKKAEYRDLRIKMQDYMQEYRRPREDFNSQLKL